MFTCSNLRFQDDGHGLFSIIRKKRFIEENSKWKVVSKKNSSEAETEDECNNNDNLRVQEI